MKQVIFTKHACPMRQRTGEIGHTATATTWADIAAQGAGGMRRGREAVDEGEMRRIHTVREERESEKKRGIHTEEQKTRYQGGQEQRYISGEVETDRSNIMETVTPPRTWHRSKQRRTKWNTREGRRKKERNLSIGHQVHNNTSNMRATNRMWRRRGEKKNRW